MFKDHKADNNDNNSYGDKNNFYNYTRSKESENSESSSNYSDNKLEIQSKFFVYEKRDKVKKTVNCKHNSKRVAKHTAY